MRKKSISFLGLVGMLAVLALAAPGTGIELPTLVTINIDGNMTDWGPVLANPVNVTEDGDGSSYGSNCSLSMDRDCEVKGGTGRDLTRFAWTYDSNNIYLYIKRWGSTSNIIRFFFVMDLGGNGFAEDTDRVLLVEWSGVKNRYDAKLCAYIPDPGGSGSDSLVDGLGYADGYRMPGTIDPNNPIITYSDVPGGNAVSGTEFEAAVSWTDLILSGPTPIKFHVASNNNTKLNEAEDNMGGPDGGVGTFSFAGVDIRPPRIKSVGPGDQVTLSHTIENLGSLDGRFDLTGTSSLGLRLEYFTDPDGDGIGNDQMGIDANGDGDFVDAADTYDAAYDFNGDGKLDFQIATGDMDHFVVGMRVPPFMNAVTDYINFRVELDSLIFVSDQVEDRLYIGYFTVYPDHQKSGVPGQYVDYGHWVTNNQGFVDTADLGVHSTPGWDLALFTDPDGNGDPSDGMEIARDLGGDGTWDTGDPDPDTGPLAPGGGTAWYVIRVFVPGAAAPGTEDTTTFTAASVLNANRAGTATDVTTAREYVTLEPDYTFADGTNLYGAAGTSVYFPFVLVNSWITADSFSLGAVSAQGWDTELWSDPDGNGSIDDGQRIANTGLVPGMGGVFHLVVELRVPDTAQGSDQDTVTVTATSNLDSNQSDTAIGQMEVHALQSFRGGYMVQATYFTTCETIYTKAYGLVPGQGTRYKLNYWDPVATDPPPYDDLVSRADGTAVTFRALDATDLPGTWTLEVWDNDTSSAVDTIAIQHERSGTVSLVDLTPNPATSSNDLQISIGFTNTNTGAPYSGTKAYTRVIAPDSSVLQDDGTFTTTPGAVTREYDVPLLNAGDSTTDIFTINDVSFPENGTYTVEVVWETSCGPVIFTLGPIDGFVVDGDRDLDGIPDSVDICPDVYNPMQDLTADWRACGDCNTACTDNRSCADHDCVASACVYLPNATYDCADAWFCNGTETCDPSDPGADATTGCVPGVDPCAVGQTCYEDADTCGCTQHTDCDDSVACTDDTCDFGDGTCDFTPNHANCDDGLYCTGPETCDAVLGCWSSGDPCADPTPMCDEDNDGCVECRADGDCSDGISCTNDTCVAGACGNTPDDANCDNGWFCDGAETCNPSAPGADPVTGCVPGVFPCSVPTPICDPATNSCVECLVDAECSDGVACTVDSCVGNACEFTAGVCTSDEVFCNGVEYCDPVLDCQSPGDPCAPSLYCNEAQGFCEECQNDSHCDDGISCTNDTCSSDGTDPRTCWNAPVHSRCPDDGLFCNGNEYCSASSGCRHSGNPCVAVGLACNEETDECEGCQSDDDCDDGVDCTDDTCVGSNCIFTPNDAHCPDNGVFCDGDEVCNASAGCVSTGDPCAAAGQICNEDDDRCDECRVNADCDDGRFCNGTETCAGGSCRPGMDPCDGQPCDEINDRCAACLVDADCDNEVFCDGAEYCTGGMCQIGMDPCPGQICNEARGECLVCEQDSDCTDAWYCNGVETCWDGVAGATCRPGLFPCPGQFCEEETDTCVDCRNDVDCEDGIWCNGAEICQDGACQAGADPCPGLICDEDADACQACEQDSDCDDGLYCNGAETCMLGMVCAAGADPCPGQLCDEDNNRCMTCTQDSDCNDGLFCNGEETCVGGICSEGSFPCPPLMCDEDNDSCKDCLVDSDCDDGKFCSGIETCVNGTCAAGSFPCPGQKCDEVHDRCGDCLTAIDCDDGLFCNGIEICLGGSCWSGTDPCPGEHCDETDNACVECLADNHCDDGMYCTGTETCVDGVCQVGTDPCPDLICDELHNECQTCMQNSDCDNGLWCDGIETCVGWMCTPGSDPCPGMLCNEDNDQCKTCAQDSDCDDGLFCNGLETCVMGVVCIAGTDPCPGSLCDDGLDACVECLEDSDCADEAYCNGAEVCIDGACEDGTDDPCPSQLCDEIQDQCVPCMQDSDCDDGVYCNGSETCAGGFCQLGADPCPGLICDEGYDECKSCSQDWECDDGLFCTGIETCVGGVCQVGTDPCPGLFCDETYDECTGCATDVDCDDGLWCTGTETCMGGYCVPSAPPCPGQVCDETNDQCMTCTQDSDCDDGWFCNGQEACVDGFCYLGHDPCPGQVCNEVRDECWACLLDHDCDDGLWCTGREICQGGVCLQSGDPCNGEGCDEDNDICLQCTTDHDCDDGLYCTGDRTCSGGLCWNGTDPCPGKVCEEITDSCRDCISDAECDDGLYCSGVETCLAGTCETGADPCPGLTCDEDFDICTGCTADAECDDGLWCTGLEICVHGLCWPGADPCPGKVCEEDVDSCRDCMADAECDDGFYCNGAETCVAGVAGATCESGADPCPGRLCDESADSCMTCTLDVNCDDGLYCNGREVCFNGFCYEGQDPCPGQICDEIDNECKSCTQDSDCDDGLYCDGAESCVGATCQVGTDPCPGQACDETGNACTDCLVDWDCDDGLWCNGQEVCAAGTCHTGTDPCPDQPCDEVTDACVDCVIDDDCDDGVYCNGAEACVDDACQAGSDPCPGQICNEDDDACVACVTDIDCDDGLWCNGDEICVGGACQAGTQPCTAECDEVNDICPCTNDSDCDNGDWCDGDETCNNGQCHAGIAPCPWQPCDEDLDQCVDWWEDKDVRGGGCQCGAKGTSQTGLVLLLLVGLASLRNRRCF